MKIYLHRLGCVKAEIDHSRLATGLHNRGATFVNSIRSADTVLISTCAFIGDARAEAVESILEAVEWKKKKPSRRLYVTGCLPVRYEDELRVEIPEVDGWFGFGKWGEAIQVIAAGPSEFPHETHPVPSDTSSHPGQIPAKTEQLLDGLPAELTATYAYIKIAEGCNRRCAYCAIPSIRGPYRSRPPRSILLEAASLLARGTRELILVAQELNSYGIDLSERNSAGNPYRIEHLIGELSNLFAKSSGTRWLRLMYTHPPLYSDSFVAALKDSQCLVPYLDYPVEHADNKVLRSMGRGTTWKDMVGWMEKLRSSIPGIALRTSIIVGHPGEGQKEFDTLVDRLEQVRFERLGVFRFSSEVGTRAASKAKPEETDSFEREEILRSLAFQWAEEWYASRQGMTVQMLVEENHKNYSGGRTWWDAPDIDGSAMLTSSAKVGSIVTGVIRDATPFEFTLERQYEYVKSGSKRASL